VSFRDEGVLSELLRFRPWPNGDPGPEIYQLVQEELSSNERRQFLATLVGIEMAMTEARLGGLKQIQGLLGSAREG
jgi:hypothetical protein